MYSVEALGFLKSFFFDENQNRTRETLNTMVNPGLARLELDFSWVIYLCSLVLHSHTDIQSAMFGFHRY